MRWFLFLSICLTLGGFVSILLRGDLGSRQKNAAAFFLVMFCLIAGTLGVYGYAFYEYSTMERIPYPQGMAARESADIDEMIVAFFCAAIVFLLVTITRLKPREPRRVEPPAPPRKEPPHPGGTVTGGWGELR